MDFSWVHGLLYGLFCGYSQFLPVSSEAHRVLFLQLTGLKSEGTLARLAVHIAVLLALILSCWPMLSRIRRERYFASIPLRKRRRQPDKRTMMTLHLVRTAAVPLLLSFAAYPWTAGLAEGRVWFVALMLIVNGLFLYWPQFLPGANKDALTLSRYDAVLIGLGGGLGVIPGLSGIGIMNAVGQMRGADRRYMTDVSLLLCIPVLIVRVLMDFYSMIDLALTGAMLLSAAAAAVTAFLSAYMLIAFLRFMAVKASFAGFAYYSWGLALLIFILYLTI